MKKVLGKIVGIILGWILVYPQFCYADVVDTIDITFTTVPFLIGFIGVIILLVSAISFFCLKATVKKQNMPDYVGEKTDILDTEEIEKRKNKIGRRFYIWTMVFSVMELIHLGLNDEISLYIFLIPILIFVLSIIVRLDKHKKLSNIICGVSVVLVCIIALWCFASNKITENYNRQFVQYVKNEWNYKFAPRYISDVEGLINTAIENNKNERKVTFIYKNIHYTSVEELKQLLSKINTSNYYSMEANQDNKGYIKTITLSSYINSKLGELLQYEGEEKTGDVVKTLIRTARSEARRNRGIEIKITYMFEANQKTSIDITDFNSDEYVGLLKQIRADKKYDVELQGDIDSCNIIITNIS